MKNILFKSVCLVLLCCGAALTANAQGIKVVKKNGTVVYYKASEVESVGVYGYGEEPEPTISGKDANGRAWVDLGLPSGTKWATCNVGANEPEDYGDYFAWGETEKKDDYSKSKYKFYSPNSYGTLKLTKYCTVSSYGTVDDKTELEPEDDAATVNWGNGWQMPSAEQMAELYDDRYTTTSWTNQKGINGWLIVSKKNDNRIFLPAAGYKDGMTPKYESEWGHYWSRTLNTNGCNEGSYLDFYSAQLYLSYTFRYEGLSVRPVRVGK